MPKCDIISTWSVVFGTITLTPPSLYFAGSVLALLFCRLHPHHHFLPFLCPSIPNPAFASGNHSIQRLISSLHLEVSKQIQLQLINLN